MNIFISYSHADESYRKQLDIHLSILKRNKVISAWTDRKIIPGQEWGSEIDENLESAGIVLLLVSPDFLDSEYCYEKEMKRAIERHESGYAIVVPTIIRPCDWKDTPFSKLQALPSDAKAVSKWGDQDDAWLDVVTELKKSIRLAKERIKLVVVQEAIWSNYVSKEFSDWLNDTEIELRHRRVDKVFLDDVFVWPDLKVLDDDIDRISKSVKADSPLKKEEWLLVFGDEQSGKTTLCKMYFKELVYSGWWPILVQGEDIKSSDIASLIKSKSEEQYSNEVDYEKLKGKVLIIDNFSLLSR